MTVLVHEPASEESDSPTTNKREGIVWLASFPKSGNTWFRIFLQHLVSGPDAPVKLQGLSTSIASARGVFDEHSGLDSSDLSHEEIDFYRPRVYERMVAKSKTFPMFMKTHDAWTRLPNGKPVLSAKATAGAICLVRNPLDVAVSFAYHGGHENFDNSIEMMGSRENGHFCHGRKRLQNQLRQLMFGWSGYIESWLDAEVPIHVIRYEDMKATPTETFSGAVEFAGLKHTREEVEAALEKSKFENLKKKEEEEGFREKQPNCKAFFRKGTVGSWRENLTDEQRDRVINDHRVMMEKFGYIDENGELTV